MASTLGKLVALIALTLGGCMPLHDLDKAAGRAGGAGATGTFVAGDTGGTVTDAGGLGAGGQGGAAGAWARDGAVDSTKDVAGETGTVDAPATGGAGGFSASGGTTSLVDVANGTGGISASGGADAGDAPAGGGCPGASTAIAPGLPDIFNSPVDGKITYSEGASWDIDGEQWPAFEIHTPTASYWLVKSAAAMVSITDTSQLQWINFSSGFRPNRGVPNLGGCCAPGNPSKLGLPTMSTDLDPSFTVTSTHLRLVSKSKDETYWLVWDFFLTHFTLTINRSAKAFGFTYRGVPGGAFGATDQLVLSSGEARSSTASYSGDLPGPAEWAYLTHPAAKQSLFLIQHADDSLADTYRIADGDTGMFVFGNGQMCQLPVRFSLGLIDSCDDQLVRKRIDFVRNAIP